MGRQHFYHCRICHSRCDSARVPGITVCEPDHIDMVRLKALYTTIVTKHPSLRKNTTAEIFERLWVWYLKQNNIEEAPKPAPVELTIDELDKVF